MEHNRNKSNIFRICCTECLKPVNIGLTNIYFPLPQHSIHNNESNNILRFYCPWCNELIVLPVSVTKDTADTLIDKYKSVGGDRVVEIEYKSVGGDPVVEIEYKSVGGDPVDEIKSDKPKYEMKENIKKG